MARSVCELAGTGPARRTTADVHGVELGLRRRPSEVGNEPRIVVDRPLKCGARGCRQPLHRRAPLRFDLRGGSERRLERRRGVDLQGPHRDAGQSELRLNHFSLLGDAQRAVDGTGRLRSNRQVGGAAASPDAAAAAVEQRNRHAVLAAGGDDRFLRLVELPRRGQPADFLCRIGVADHHLLPTPDPNHAIAIPGDRQQSGHHVGRGAQIARGFEEWHDPQRRVDACFALQQFNGEHVRGASGLRDHVGAERLGVDGCEHPEGIEHLRHPRAGRSARQRGSQQPLIVRQRHSTGNRFAVLRVQPS